MLETNVSESQIIAVNLEDGDYNSLEHYKELYNLVNNRLLTDKMNYVFLDEVQQIEHFQKAVDSFILYRVGRYDVKGKQHLATGSKYYLADIGLRYYLLGSRQVDFGHILENIVYLELLRRGYKIHIGKMGNTEVDFVAFNEEGIEYYQVALTVMDENTLKRELTPLDSISDHNPKYLLTLDNIPLTSYNGIKQINALEWLLK